MHPDHDRGCRSVPGDHRPPPLHDMARQVEDGWHLRTHCEPDPETHRRILVVCGQDPAGAMELLWPLERAYGTVWGRDGHAYEFLWWRALPPLPHREG